MHLSWIGDRQPFTPIEWGSKRVRGIQRKNCCTGEKMWWGWMDLASIRALHTCGYKWCWSKNRRFLFSVSFCVALLSCSKSELDEEKMKSTVYSICNNIRWHEMHIIRIDMQSISLKLFQWKGIERRTKIRRKTSNSLQYWKAQMKGKWINSIAWWPWCAMCIRITIFSVLFIVLSLNAFVFIAHNANNGLPQKPK